ncbi:MAG: hypothetical protein GJT30_18255 [Geobacter sp.]|nr:hypothetical protein [Geobacter sp.]
MVIHTMKRLGIFCLFAALVPCTAVWGDNTDMQQRRGGGHRKPPQEAYDACKGKNEGTAVEVTTPRGTMKAVCKSMDGQMVAVPEGAPPPRDNAGGQQ